MSISGIKTAIDTISGFNECVNFFQWVKSLWSEQSGAEKDDVRQFEGFLQCLRDTLPVMRDFIDRAEWRSHQKYVAELLPELKDAMYDAEDLVEDFKCYEQKVGSGTSAEAGTKSFHNFIQHNFNKLTQIHKRLENQLSLLKGMGLHKEIPRFDTSVRPKPPHFPTEARIFGRDDQIKKLIELLGVPKRKRNKMTSIPVLPITGIGGVGKTTLAQTICKNAKVNKHFDVIVWICVSDDFDVKRLTKEAIEQFPGTSPTKDNLKSLQDDLANRIKDRRFLIVLDDMWEEKKEPWKTFYEPFKHVLEGSMMLVTTRSPKVANNVLHAMDKPFPLEGLEDNVFREFFKQCVFGSDASHNNPELEWIGEQILLKLKGIPLAAKTIGRLLGSKPDLDHWRSILSSELWEIPQEGTDILPALRLSYIYLPFNLKRCFSFCAVYPKDYNFVKEDLAEIWVAEGFVEPKGYKSLQQTACDYFEELESLSFFQKQLRGKYVIHDLMHDMAQLVSKDECFIIKEKNDLDRIPQNIRHLSVLKSKDVKHSDLENLCKYTKLRTILCNVSLRSKTGKTMMEKWCAELLCMRVMVCASISKWGLPDSISNMKSLRYLKISDDCLFNSLPAAFCDLYNLQVLSARKCRIKVIPKGFGNLINLQKFESKLLEIDAGLLNNFKLITEELCICNLCEIRYPTIFSSLEEILEEITVKDCPRLSRLEQFLQPAYMRAIKKMVIKGCTSLESVPVEWFGDLPSLEVLAVYNCPKINSQRLVAPSLKWLNLDDSGNLGDDIDCRSLTRFQLSRYHLTSLTLNGENVPLLTNLVISGCRELETLNGWDWPILETLNISSCPRLKWENGVVLPSSLQEIYLEDCGYFPVRCLQNLTSLILLKMETCKHIKVIARELWCSNLNSLQELTIKDCEDLVSIGGPEAIAHIPKVEILNCPKLKEIRSR